MKNFFDREENRLKYITERKAIRAKEKDEFDIEHTEVKTEANPNGETAAQGAQTHEQQEGQETNEGEEENEEEKEALKMEEEFKEIEKIINNETEDLIISDNEGEKPKTEKEEYNDNNDDIIS
ncbi:hypothetical protein BCR32DRAFT_123258 [Anaeromyces robustus]|nr:hypothetical protein BCR32DRAFT_307376 [Anaeromyces robustus]ORX64867.1 hypothetical protein BCR32DRAFT_123258 [Anaeromyces robustus]|eukprot:ORX63707.1 hypothetical protein BCR32DRAFT_307376 [Anaeromyces robustus]